MNNGVGIIAKNKIAAQLLEAKLIDEAVLAKAQEIQKQKGGSLGQALVQAGGLDEATYTDFLSKLHNLPMVDLDSVDVQLDCIDLIPAEVANKFQVLPINRKGRVLTVGMANPGNIFAIDDIKFITGCEVETCVASDDVIKKAIDRFYDSAESLASVMAEFDDDVEIVIREDGQVEVEYRNAQSGC